MLTFKVFYSFSLLPEFYHLFCRHPVAFLKGIVSFSVNRKILLDSVSLQSPALVQMEQSYITGQLVKEIHLCNCLCVVILKKLSNLLPITLFFPFRPLPETNRTLTMNEVYLIDSGAQYV